MKVEGRYSDEQLYALALYVYSLKNRRPTPDKLNAMAARVQKGTLLIAKAFAQRATRLLSITITSSLRRRIYSSGDHMAKYDILRFSAAPIRADYGSKGRGYWLSTRSHPSSGVWYRSMFGHSGWCATLGRLV